MGRLFESPIAVTIIFLIVIAIIIIAAVSISTKRKLSNDPTTQFGPGFGGQMVPNATGQTLPSDAVQALLEQQRFAHNDLLTRTGQGHRSTAWILAVIGLFVFGIILGPIAMIVANKAESYGVPAPGGKILGLIDTIFGVLIILFYVSNQ